MTLVVSGTKQEIIITEEDGCFTIEMADTAHKAPMPAAVLVSPVPASAAVREPVQEEEQAADTLPPSLQPFDDALYKRLVLLRKALATANEVPPYLIFHDKTLREMVDKMPTNMQDMGHISGVGQAKLEKYGPVFLDVINGADA